MLKNDVRSQSENSVGEAVGQSSDNVTNLLLRSVPTN